MRNAIATAAIASFAFFLAPDAEAATLPSREVRIDAERLATMPFAEQERVLEIRDRLQALLETDRSSLDKEQRSGLRSEWKELKSEMDYYNRNGNVVYISTGALIIIVLLLIIIL